MGRNIDTSSFAEKATQEDTIKSSGGGSKLFKETKVEFLNKKFDDIANAGEVKKKKIGLLVDFMLYVTTKGGHPKVDESNPSKAWYNRIYFVHNLDRKGAICPRTFGETCPICDKADKLKRANNWFTKGTQQQMKANNPELHSYIKSMEPRERYLYPVRWKNELHLLDMSKGNLQKELELALESSPDNIKGSFFNDKGGCTAKIKITLDDFNGNAYWKATDVEFTEGREDISDAMCDAIDELDMDSIFNMTSKADLQAMVDAVEMVEDEMEEDDVEDNTTADVAAPEVSGRRRSFTEEEPVTSTTPALTDEDDFS